MPTSMWHFGLKFLSASQSSHLSDYTCYAAAMETNGSLLVFYRSGEGKKEANIY